jgi:hypothetical protein
MIDVLMAASKMAAFWVVLTACTMDMAGTSETLVNFYHTTWHYNPEDSHLHVLIKLINMKIYTIIILLVFYVCHTRHLNSRKEHRLRVSENKVL